MLKPLFYWFCVCRRSSVSRTSSCRDTWPDPLHSTRTRRGNRPIRTLSHSRQSTSLQVGTTGRTLIWETFTEGQDESVLFVLTRWSSLLLLMLLRTNISLLVCKWSSPLIWKLNDRRTVTSVCLSSAVLLLLSWWTDSCCINLSSVFRLINGFMVLSQKQSLRSSYNKEVPTFHWELSCFSSELKPAIDPQKVQPF